MRRVLELEPDLVVAVKEENTRENIEALEEAGVPVFVGAPESVEEAIELLQELADRVEAPRAGAVLGPVERVYGRLREKQIRDRGGSSSRSGRGRT